MERRLLPNGALGIFFALLLCTGAQAGTVQGTNDHLIVPGQRIGPVSLGMSDRDLFKLGVPNITKPLGKLIAYFYDDMRVFVDGSSHKVIYVSMYRNESYHTAEGIGLGASLRDVESKLGPPESVKGNPFFGNAPIGVKYHSGNLYFSFSGVNASMADRPSDSVQKIEIQIPGASMF